MNQFRRKNQSGFTLIELIIVAAVIAILVSIALPSYQDSVMRSRRADVMDGLLDCAAVQARNFSSSSPPTYMTNAQLTASGLCNGMQSPDGLYNFVVTNPSCTQNATRWCFVITAIPPATSSQRNDVSCRTWTIDHRGRKTALDLAATDTTAFCWKQ